MTSVNTFKAGALIFLVHKEESDKGGSAIQCLGSQMNLILVVDLRIRGI